MLMVDDWSFYVYTARMIHVVSGMVVTAVVGFQRERYTAELA